MDGYETYGSELLYYAWYLGEYAELFADEGDWSDAEVFTYYAYYFAILSVEYEGYPESYYAADSFANAFYDALDAGYSTAFFCSTDRGGKRSPLAINLRPRTLDLAIRAV